MKLFNYFIAVVLAICMVSCGEKENLNEVTLKVEADLNDLGNYLTVVDKEVTITKSDAEEDDESGFAFKSSICVNVSKTVASNYSFGFKVQVLDKDHIEIGELPASYYWIESSKQDDGLECHEILSTGKKHAVMNYFVSKDDWEDEDLKTWEKICKEGVYLVIKPKDYDAKFVAYSGSDSDDEGIEEEEEESIIDDDDELSSSSGSEDWDALLDSYEEYVNKYVSVMKKASKGDLSAMSEYPALMEKAQEFSDKMKNAQGSMSTSQWARYNKITMKMLEAAESSL